MAKNSSPSRAPKNWRSTPGQPGGARKNGLKRPKNPSNRLAATNTAIQIVAIMSRFSSSNLRVDTDLHVENMKLFQKFVD